MAPQYRPWQFALKSQYRTKSRQEVTPGSAGGGALSQNRWTALELWPCQLSLRARVWKLYISIDGDSYSVITHRWLSKSEVNKCLCLPTDFRTLSAYSLVGTPSYFYKYKSIIIIMLVYTIKTYLEFSKYLVTLLTTPLCISLLLSSNFFFLK